MKVLKMFSVHQNSGWSPVNTILICLTAILVAMVTVTSGDHVTLPPFEEKNEDARGVALILVPEKGTDSADYQLFGYLLQHACPQRLWVAVMDTSREAALNLGSLTLLIEDVKQELSQAGWTKKSDLFLAVHGQLGHLVSVYVQAMPEARGLVLLGTHLPRDFSPADFPVSVMTVVGELDGVARITRIASTVQAMEEASALDPDLIVRSPLVMIEGSNHGVFLGNILPDSLHMLDIEPEVDETEALQAVTDLIALFISNTVGEPQGSDKRARDAFTKSFGIAQEITQPIRSLRNLTQEDMKSYWVKSAQKWLSGLEGPQSSLIEVDSFVTDYELLPLPPTLGVEGGINYVITFSDVVQPGGSDDVQADDGGTSPQAPLEIAARMIGPERIQKYLTNTTINRNYTCSDLNYASFMTAYHSASPAARTRYDRVERGVHFQPDTVTNSEVLWQNTPLEVTTVDKHLHVKSISYQTRNDESLSQYAGLYFCKLLPPDRALEWIYVDSIRRNVASPDVR